jgi:Abnormal spindle-like microcephaly-assoc'd, ASPM-SPD-2-Hydin
MDFGAVAVGETRERTLSITNVGSEPAVFSVIGVSSGSQHFTWNFGDFLQTCPLTGPVLLSPGERCELTVIAQPATSSGPGTPHEGTFRIGNFTTGETLVLIPLAVRAM